MSSKYEKSYQEEGSFHVREIQPISPNDDDNYGEYTSSRRKVNHKTRQVETRVSRQLLIEDGKVIADSGPQVTTKIKDDNKLEEIENEKAPKNKAGESSGRVLGEKRETQKVSREVREENMQFHDERFEELSGHDIHRKAIQAPHEFTNNSSAPRGKMVHYSNKGKIYQDTDEILEISKLAIDGSITKEVKQTKHHEECSEDELPDEKGEAEALRARPVSTRSSRRHVDYVNDFDPSSSSGDEIEFVNRAQKSKHLRPTSTSTSEKQHRIINSSRRNQDDEAETDSLRDDFRPNKSAHAGSRHREMPSIRRTTTTTMSAGLQDRPRSRQEVDRRSPVKETSSSSSTREKSQQTEQLTDKECLSLASLGANATIIRVSYKRDQENMEKDAETIIEKKPKAIIAPARLKEPELPLLIELARSGGGRSYYLELNEPRKKASSIKSPNIKRQDTIVRRQSGLPVLPQLASSTRPTKYSIYGGFKEPNADRKPVPRLSYSRAIGPKSQRRVDNQPKTPSRYLKMK